MSSSVVLSLVQFVIGLYMLSIISRCPSRVSSPGSIVSVHTSLLCFLNCRFYGLVSC